MNSRLKLKHKNVELVEYTLGDINRKFLNKYQKWIKTKKVNKYLEKKSSSKKDLTKFLNKMIISKNNILFKILFQQKHIGNLRLSFEKKNVGFGIMIGNKDFHNKKISTKAFYMILKLIFIKLNRKKIILKSVNQNLPAMRLYRKFLMKEKKLNNKFTEFYYTRKYYLKIRKYLNKIVNRN